MTEASELSLDPLVRYTQLRDSRWLFLKHCVFTHDEVDEKTPVKLFPSHLTYVFFLVQMWIKHKRLAVPKSRRMFASWTFIGLATHDVIFHKGKSWAFVSKKEEDSKELVQRAEFIIKHIPPEILSPDLIPKMKRGEMQSSPPVIELDFGNVISKIQGFPQGANQLRQRGFSGILCDECAFWEEAEDAFASAEPTIKGGGRMIMISSRATEDKGFFKRLCFDQLDRKDSRFAEVPPVAPKSPMEGIEVWKNPKNEFTVIDLHYTANPAKRGEEFRESLRRTLPIRKYRMEYEKSWETFEGKPVYEDFNERIHVAHIRPKIVPGLPLLLGWDSSGLTPACIIAQLQDDRLLVVKEIIGEGMGANRFVPLIAQTIAMEFPQISSLDQTVSFFDPAAFKRNEITEETYLNAMISGGFRQVRPGPVTWKKRVEGVTDFLCSIHQGQPKMLIYEAECPVLVAGFKGGFRYPESITSVEPDIVRPVKDVHSHPHDGLQYLCGGIKANKNYLYEINIPTPSYGFQKNSHSSMRSSNYGRK